MTANVLSFYKSIKVQSHSLYFCLLKIDVIKAENAHFSVDKIKTLIISDAIYILNLKVNKFITII